MRPLSSTVTKLRSYGSWPPIIVVAGASLVLTERLFRLVDHYAVNVFFSDQWEFNDATIFQQHSIWQIFTWQHGPHRQGLGGVLAKLLEPYFQWDSRIESFLILGIFVFAGVLALWLKRRIYGSFEYYDLVIPSLFLTATQCEVIFGAANLAHGSLPLLLVVIYCLAWTVRSLILRFAVILVVNFLLIFTGFGLLMGLITPLALLGSLWLSPAAQRQYALHVSAALVAVISLSLFFVNYTWNPAVSCYDSVLVSRTTGSYFRFAALMLSNYVGFDGLTSKHPGVWGGLVLVFFIVVFAIVVAMVLRSGKASGETSPFRAIIPFVLLAFSLAFCAATANGRLCLGFGAAQESRYMPYLTPGFLGAYFYLRRVFTNRWLHHAALTLFLLVCAYASWPIHLGDQVEMSGFRDGKLRWKNCYLAHKDVAFCTRQTGVRISNPPETPYLQPKLDFLEDEHLNLFDGR